VARFVGQGRNIDLSKFLLTDAEFAQAQQSQQADRVAETVATEAGSAAVQTTQG